MYLKCQAVYLYPIQGSHFFLSRNSLTFQVFMTFSPDFFQGCKTQTLQILKSVRITHVGSCSYIILAPYAPLRAPYAPLMHPYAPLMCPLRTLMRPLCALTCPYVPLMHPLCALMCPYVPLHTPYVPLKCPYAPLMCPYAPLMHPLCAPYVLLGGY